MSKTIENRLQMLERAIHMHRYLIEDDELPREAVDAALWNIYDNVSVGCTGGCCGPS